MPAPASLGPTLWLRPRTLTGYAENDAVPTLPDLSDAGRSIVGWPNRFVGGLFKPNRLCGHPSLMDSGAGFAYGAWDDGTFSAGDPVAILGPLTAGTGFTVYNISNLPHVVSGVETNTAQPPQQSFWKALNKVGMGAVHYTSPTPVSRSLQVTIRETGSVATYKAVRVTLPDTIPLGPGAWVASPTYWAAVETHFDGTVLTLTQLEPTESAAARSDLNVSVALSTTDQFGVGQNGVTGVHELAELVVFDRALVDDERTSMRAYIRRTYDCLRPLLVGSRVIG